VKLWRYTQFVSNQCSNYRELSGPDPLVLQQAPLESGKWGPGLALVRRLFLPVAKYWFILLCVMRFTDKQHMSPCV